MEKQGRPRALIHFGLLKRTQSFIPQSVLKMDDLSERSSLCNWAVRMSALSQGRHVHSAGWVAVHACTRRNGTGPGKWDSSFRQLTPLHTPFRKAVAEMQHRVCADNRGVFSLLNVKDYPKALDGAGKHRDSLLEATAFVIFLQQQKESHKTR